MEKSFYEKKNEERIGLSEREETFSGRRIGQFACLSKKEELVALKSKIVYQKEEIVQKIKYKRICQKEKNIS